MGNFEYSKVAIGGTLLGIGVMIIVLGGPAFIVLYALIWLKTGTWPHFSIGTLIAMAPPHLSWAGAQKLLDGWWASDVSWTVMSIGVAISYWGYLWNEDA